VIPAAIQLLELLAAEIAEDFLRLNENAGRGVGTAPAPVTEPQPGIKPWESYTSPPPESQ
jgi:hypothetical protein